MSGGFDTEVPGSPGSVRAGAAWLRGSVAQAVGAAADHVADARNEAASEFLGQAGQAYSGYATTILTRTDEHTSTVEAAAQAFDDYAARLETSLERMAALRGAAQSSGLKVTGTVVHEPEAPAPVPDLVGPVTPEQQAQHDQQVSDHDTAAGQVAVYDQLFADAQNEVTTYVDWVDTHLTARLGDFVSDAIDYLWNEVKQNAASLGVATVLETNKHVMEGELEKIKAKVHDLESAHRSGNPARRATGRLEDPGNSGNIRRLLDEASEVRGGIKLLGAAAVLYDTYSALESDEPGKGLFEVGAGIAGAALVVAVLPEATAGAIVVAAGVGAGWVTSKAAGALWDALPDGVTKPVDHAVGVGWDHTKDGALAATKGYLHLIGFR
jgi:hypothetical protein